MILFQNDWNAYPNAIVHTTTANRSFLKMHFILKEMGIKNNAFFLALHDQSLKDVDPFNMAKMTPELALKIGIEIKINPWYYLREIVRIPASGTDPIHYRLNRAGMFLYWAFFNSCNLFLIQPRQTGKTITSETLIVLLMYFIYKNTRIKLFTHSTQLIHENIEKFKLIRDELPPYLIDLTTKDTENKEEVKYAALKNTYATKTAQQSTVGAFNAGRGGTVLVNQLDEMPFCPNIHISYPVLMNAKNAAIANAKENNIPFADIITTTAGRLDTDSGAYVYDIMQKSLAFNERFYDLSSNAELRYLLKNGSKNNMLYGEFSFRQLGFTREWADEVIRENNLQGDEILRDIENKWTSGSERPCVDPELLTKIDDNKTDPIKIEEVDNYLFKWYENPEALWKDESRYFAIGLDASENIDEDFTTVHMLDIADLATVMTSRCNDQDLIKLGHYLANLLIKHTNIVLIPERKSTATVLISIICADLWNAGINPFTRIYNRVFQNRSEPPFNKIDTSTTYATEGPTKKYIGYTTTATGENSRDALYKFTLNRALKINYSSIKDRNLIQELKTLVLNRQGRIDHLATKHDDSVIAFLLASWFVIHGRNHHLYGIPNHIKLSRVAPEGGVVDVTKSDRRRALGTRISQLKRQIDNTRDAIVRSSLEREQHFLNTQLESLGPEVHSMETIGDVQQVQDTGITIEEAFSDLIDERREYHRKFEYAVKDPFASTTKWFTV